MTNKEKLLQEAIALNEDKKYQEVDDLLTDEVLEKYKDATLYAEKARVLYKLKKYAECERIADIGLRLDPNNAIINNSLGNIYSDRNEYGKAERYYKRAIVLDPNYSIAYNNLGILYKDKKDNENAEKYYKIAIEKDSNNSAPYYNLALYFFNKKDYKESKENYKNYIKLENDDDEFYLKLAKSRIEEIDKILESSSYKTVSNLIGQIKELLLFKGDFITHYTGISTAQNLVLNQSPMRLSEGSFLNDTSEGEELFKFLDYFLTTNKKSNEILFTKRPFIGSFVDDEKNNDLTLWRMYGKENLEEAKGCSITINSQELKNNIKNKINPTADSSRTGNDDIEFYRVAYRNENSFEFAGATDAVNKELTKLMNDLKEEIKKFDKKKINEVEIIELLNSIAYLFKSVEYKYENEVRLVINEAIGFDRKIDFEKDSKDNFKPSSNPNKVYIELVPISSLLTTITIGPKVAKAEEWASTFHYHLLNNGHKPEIHISKIPFK